MDVFFVGPRAGLHCIERGALNTKIWAFVSFTDQTLQVSDVVLEEFCDSIQQICVDRLSDCRHPFQIKVMWACIEMLKHLHINELQRPFDFVNLATILMAEFVRLQLPGSRIPSTLELPKPIEKLVISFFKPYFGQALDENLCQ